MMTKQKAFSGKRVLVTGASGLIGSHLVKRLMNEGAFVFALGRSEEKLRAVFNVLDGDEKLFCLAGNVADAVPCDIGKLDYIFHAAGPVSGFEIQTKPVDTIIPNITGTTNCLDFLKKQGSGRLIVFSSATVYGNAVDNEVHCCEEDTDRAERLSNAAIAYSESKRMIEVIAGAYARQFDVDVCIIRPGYVYGYTKNMPNTAFYEFIGKAVRGEDIVINASRMSRRDNIYVEDVVDGILCVAENGVKGEAYNISSNGEGNNSLSACEMAEIVRDCVNKKFGGNISVLYSNGKCDSLPGVLLDNSKIKSIGWTLKTDSLTGIYDTVENAMRERQ